MSQPHDTDSTLIGARLLVVDDERAVRRGLSVLLGKAGMTVETAEHADDALSALRAGPFDAVLTDVNMPGTSGLELLERVRTAWPHTAVIVMTGRGRVDDAVMAMKAGAADYMVKPIERAELLLILQRALNQRALRVELTALKAEVAERYGFDKLVGNSAAMTAVYEQVAAVADASAPVLLQGPTGTGKELLAHALHHRSQRADGPFVRINCTALPESLLESELFGHERGAFTGAVRQHIGKFEAADGGTLFLDEIGETSLTTQAKLLRVLEAGEFQRVGGRSTQTVDVRVVSATNRNLATEVEAGRFRQDLFYRLNVVTVRVPALQERPEDIPLLVEHFVRTLSPPNERLPVSAQDMAALTAWTWPGNVRQLEHTVERALLLNRDPHELRIPLPHNALGQPQPPSPAVVPAPQPAAAPLPTPVPAPQPDERLVPLKEQLAAVEREALLRALRQHDGVQLRAAEALGISTSNFSYRLKKLGIRRASVRYEAGGEDDMP